MKYYILYKNENRGPLEPSEMEDYDLNPKSRVWAPGWPSWNICALPSVILAASLLTIGAIAVAFLEFDIV